MPETTRSWPEFTRTLGATLPLLDDMVSALRDVHGTERVDLLEEREFNALH